MDRTGNIFYLHSAHTPSLKGVAFTRSIRQPGDLLANKHACLLSVAQRKTRTGPRGHIMSYQESILTTFTEGFGIVPSSQALLP